MPTRRSLLAGAGTFALAGCLGGETPAGDEGSNDPKGSSTETPESTSVEYVVRTGSVPREFAAAIVSLRAVFVDRTDDLGNCYPEVYEGPYAPTITPLKTPAGDCHRSEAFEIDLTDIEGEHSVGDLTAPGSASGHAFIATSVEGCDGDGNAITAIKNTGGAPLLEVTEQPEGAHGVELSIEAVEDDRDYDYWFVWEEFDPEA